MIRDRAGLGVVPDVPSAGCRHSARCQGHVLPRQMRNLSSGGLRTGITSMNSQGVDLLCKTDLAIHRGLTRERATPCKLEVVDICGNVEMLKICA